jgi:hypothetical protein
MSPKVKYAISIVRLLGYDAYYDVLAKAALAAAVKNIGSKRALPLGAAQTEKIHALLSAQTRGFRKVFLKRMVDAFCEHFTTAELRALFGFYSSDLGRKAKESQVLLQQCAAEASHDLGLAVGSVAAELLGKFEHREF